MKYNNFNLFLKLRTVDELVAVKSLVHLHIKTKKYLHHLPDKNQSNVTKSTLLSYNLKSLSVFSNIDIFHVKITTESRNV